MRKRISLLCVFWVGLAVQFVMAGPQDWQSQVLRYRWDDKGNYPSFIRFKAGGGPAYNEVGSFLKAVLRLEDDTFQLLRTERDQIGQVHYTFQQIHDGIPVEGGIYKVHMQDGRVVTMNGRIFRIAQKGLNPMPETSGLGIAVNAVPAERYVWESAAEVNALRYATGKPFATFFPEGELVWMRNKGNQSAEAVRLAWKYDVFASKPVQRADVYVDALTGEVIFQNSKIHHMDVTGSAMTFYSGTQSIVTDSFAGGYRLREAGRAAGVETYNMQFGTDYGQAVDFLDTDNVWNNVNPNYDQAATDGHWGAEMTFDYYMQRHGRSSFDGLGSKLLSYIHFSQNYSNAFWDGIRMTYGSGGGNSRPFCSLDVVGHEFSHGVTGTSAGLIYQDEPGALNESFSDIFGASIEFFARPNDANWSIGEDLGGIRNMANPSLFNNPDTYHGSYWVTGSFDNGGVHFNSGVQNFWYVLLSDGGSGTNDNGDAYSVSGISIDTASRIAFRNLTTYLTVWDEYVDARFYAIESAVDLFGECSNEMIQTVNAWYAVGVGNPFTGNLEANFYTPDTNSCLVPSIIQFQNNSFSALQYIWQFGDGGTSNDEHPVHTYQNAGTYTVTLIAIGCNGQRDTLVMPNHIVIDPNIPCVVNMPSGNGSMTQTGCFGELYDSGGSQNYLDNTFSTTTIQVSAGNVVTLSFLSFEFAPGDNVKVYDGPDTQSPLLVTLTGNTVPSSIVSSGNSLTIRETTNGFNTREGFHATWACEVVSAAEGVKPVLSVWPNPTEGKVAFAVEQLNGELGYKVYDLMGRVMLSGKGVANGRFQQGLDLGGMAKGVYLLEVLMGEEKVVRRIELR